MRIKIGQTYQLLSGDAVTVMTLPNSKGWLRAHSQDVGYERTYASFAFEQVGVKLIIENTDLNLLPR
jgi:hypothetical protein